MIASMPSLVAADFVAAKVSYAAIAPMLIVFGAALVGVLVEAFAPRPAALRLQVGLTLVALVAALAAVVLVSRNAPGQHRWSGPWSSTARRCSCRAPCWCCPSWASSPWPSVRRRGPGRVHPQGAAVPGSPQEALAPARRRRAPPRSSR